MATEHSAGVPFELELLRLIAGATKGSTRGLPADTIRFTLEFLEDAPDLGKVRAFLTDILESSTFDLQPLGTEIPRFVVLQFPGVPRTIAPPRLFATASYLADKLKLVSCVPDIGSTVYCEPDARLLRDRAPESVLTDLYCWSDASAPVDKLWALKTIRAPEAWSASNSRGSGVFVAQPDTGVAQHPELEAGSLALDKAANILSGGRDPTDPLNAGTANPGHGTATSSAVISRQQGEMIGSAPAAKVIPIRCIEDVKIFDGAPVARAILHAVSVEADVISMSLGGLYSPSIAAALQNAVAAGCIIVVASGNCVGFVVYPAFDRNALALGGTDSADKPWKGTSWGSRVDVSAPAENVYIARRAPGDGGFGTVSGGQGTSFATALTAGVAALWVSHFGRAAIRDEAAKRATTVQELFRAALKTTARKPPAWDTDFYGTGIVNAEALLKLPLHNITIPQAVIEARPSVSLTDEDRDIAEIFASAEARVMSDGFDWAKFGAEATFLAADERRRTDPTKAGLIESRVRPKPSADLEATAPQVLRRVIERARSGPNLIRPLESPVAARDPLTLLGTRPGEQESTIASQRNFLSAEGAKEIRKQAEIVFAHLDAGHQVNPESRAERQKVLENSERLLRKLATNGAADIVGIERAHLEALVLLKGRPAIKITDGKLDEQSLKGSDWEGVFTIAPRDVTAISERVGRIDLEGEHIGTGFVVGECVIMTNRHVAEAIADQVGATWIVQDRVTINFDDRGEGDEKRFRIKSLIYTGADVIGRAVDFAHLDLALFETETSNGTNSLPSPLPILERPAAVAAKQDVVVVGYPARPDISAFEDPSTRQVRQDIVSRLAQIFGLDYGRKYLAPGRIDKYVGNIPDDPAHWVFTHDCTTLAGNSGSVVSKFTDGFPIAGLHFAGRTLAANFAHGLAAVRASDKIPPDVLRHLNWMK